jgi:hypothetical protein
LAGIVQGFSPKEAERIFKVFDKDGNGKLDKEEGIQFINECDFLYCMWFSFSPRGEFVVFADI